MNGIHPLKAALDRQFDESLVQQRARHCLDLAAFPLVRLGRRPWSEAERQHLETCPRCRQLWQRWQQSSGPDAVHELLAEDQDRQDQSPANVPTQRELAAEQETSTEAPSEAARDLVRRIRQGDSTARRTLRDAYRAAVRAFLVRHGFSAEMTSRLGDEVLNEFCSRVADPQRASAQRTLRELLLTVLLQKAPTADAHEARLLWDQDCARGEYQLAVEQVRSHCNALNWQAFVLTVLGRMSFDEAAQQLGKSRAWVVTQAAVIGVRIVDQAGQYSRVFVA
jgi:hypothetical protein